jgi:crossover junction endodeoxyribonuclease RusA
MPEPRSFTIELPAGLPVLSLNSDLHWSERRRRAYQIKEAAWALARHGKIPHLDRVRIHVTFRPPDNRRRDPDNMTPMAKPAIDALVASQVLTDDSRKYVTSVSYSLGEPVKGGQLVLTITEVTETAA